jgi:hypothetical protein
MASPKAYGGYIGVARVGGKYYRCTDFGINVQQDTLFYNHVIGLNDTIPTDSTTKGETVGTIQTQRKYVRPSPIGVQGGMSFPAAIEDGQSKLNFDDIFNYAKYGNYFDIYFWHFCNVGRKFTGCRINTFNFNVTAGDIINISIDVLAKDMENNDTFEKYSVAQKLATWDIVSIGITGDAGTLVNITEGIQSFDFSVNNNATYIYTALPYPSEDVTNRKNLLPYDIRLGMQEVTGSMSIYTKDGIDFLTAATGPAVITLECEQNGGIFFSTDINVIFKPREMPGSVGTAIINVPFIGIDKAFGA